MPFVTQQREQIASNCGVGNVSGDIYMLFQNTCFLVLTQSLTAYLTSTTNFELLIHISQVRLLKLASTRNAVRTFERKLASDVGWNIKAFWKVCTTKSKEETRNSWSGNRRRGSNYMYKLPRESRSPNKFNWSFSPWGHKQYFCIAQKVHRMTPNWTQRIRHRHEKHLTYAVHRTACPKFHSLSLYYQPFSRYCTFYDFFHWPPC